MSRTHLLSRAGAWLKPERRHTLDALDRLPAEPADTPAVTEAQSA